MFSLYSFINFSFISSFVIPNFNFLLLRLLVIQSLLFLFSLLIFPVSLFTCLLILFNLCIRIYFFLFPSYMSICRCTPPPICPFLSILLYPISLSIHMLFSSTLLLLFLFLSICILFILLLRRLLFLLSFPPFYFPSSFYSFFISSFITFTVLFLHPSFFVILFPLLLFFSHFCLPFPFPSIYS